MKYKHINILGGDVGMSGLDKLLLILVIIGALNWGLVGLFGFNLVDALFGEFSLLSRVVYILVGASGLYVLVSRFFTPRIDQRVG